MVSPVLPKLIAPILVLAPVLPATGQTTGNLLNSEGFQMGPQFPVPVIKHCSGCHLPPRPGALSRDSWIRSIDAMIGFMKEKQLVPPQGEITQILQFYLGNSPETIEALPDDLEPPGLLLHQQSVGNPPKHERPQLTNVNIVDLDQDGLQDVVATDNQNGTVSWIEYDPETDSWPEIKLADVPAPVRTSVFDFEGDGDLDIAVAAMGYMHPNDDLQGEAHLLLNRGDQSFEAVKMIEKVARISDIRPGDIDGDGDTDFFVAMFGWRKTGGIIWLEQIDEKTFKPHEILKLNGAMHLYENDLDGDGRLDFMVLITQEHETIAAFRNQGGGVFQSAVIARASHPAFGSSGIRPVDFDQDGDLDILYTNGDMMDDDPIPKPYHGVRWFENQGGKFQIRHLAQVPGCYCAVPHDMDGDGDLDAVVSNLYFHWEKNEYPSLLWLENDGSQNFTRRRIAYAPTNLASIDVGDLNGDGLPDIIAGGVNVMGPTGRIGRLTVWLGRNPDPDRDSE